MSDAQPQVGYDMNEDNFRAIQSLVFSFEREFAKTKGVGRSRGHIMAEDHVASFVTQNGGQPVSGIELSAWMAASRNKLRHPEELHGPHNIKGVNGNGTAKQLGQVVSAAHREVEVRSTRDVDTFNQGLTTKRHQMDPLLAGMLEACTPIGPGEVWSIPVGSEAEARKLSTYLHKVSLKLGWRTGKYTKSYQFQIFPDRLKIKRN